MDRTGEVVLILKIAMNVAPVAVYFIILGLVNSRSHVHVVTARHDWLNLAIVFFPILIWPALWLANVGWIVSAVLALVAGVAIIVIAGPGKRSGWVIYNCDRHRVMTELTTCLNHLNLDYRCHGYAISIVGHDAGLKLTEFKLLKNVTVGITGRDRQFARKLGIELQSRLSTVTADPPLSAACILVAGVTLLIVPLSMMVNHIDSFVKVFTNLIPV